MQNPKYILNTGASAVTGGAEDTCRVPPRAAGAAAQKAGS